MLQRAKLTTQHVVSWLSASTTDRVIQRETKGESDADVHIYCIHGTADRNSAFNNLTLLLTPQLPTCISSIYLVAFEKRLQGLGIEDYAEQLLQKIINNKSKKIVLMGHSRGSLVAAYLAEYLAKNAGIEVMVIYAFGGPFYGSRFTTASFKIFSNSLAQMTEGSEFLKDLREKMMVSQHHYRFIAGGYDMLVPETSAVVSTPNSKSIVFAPDDHLGMVQTNESARYVNNDLRDLFPNHLPTEEKESQDQAAEISIQEFELIDGDEAPTLVSEIFYAIDEQINSLKSRLHMKSCVKKEAILNNLKQIISQSCLDSTTKDQTVGELIQKYLNETDEQTNQKNSDILAEPLNYFVNEAERPKVAVFVDELIQKYGHHNVSKIYDKIETDLDPTAMYYEDIEGLTCQF